MANSPKTARYRAPGPARTPLTDLADAVATNAAPIGRGAVVAALTTGLVSTVAIPAQAASSRTELASVDVSALTTNALSVLESAPVVVPANSVIDFASVDIVAVAPPPPPVVRRAPTATTSRTQARTPVATAQSSSSGAAAAAPKAEAAPKAKSAPAPAQAAEPGTILEIASRYVGTPYVHGGKTPGGFDCSGFVSYVYAQVGIKIPSSTAALRKFGTRVSAAEAKPGDLVMYSNINHVGIYAGNGMMYDAARPGKVLQYRKIFAGSTYFLRVS